MHVMNLLWQLYASRLCARSVPDHVTSLLHTHLAQAPWPAFLPTLDNLQAFNKVERIKAKLVLEKSGLAPINGCVMYSNNLSIPCFISWVPVNMCLHANVVLRLGSNTENI